MTHEDLPAAELGKRVMVHGAQGDAPRWAPLSKGDNATNNAYDFVARSVVWGYMWRLLGDEAGVEGAQQLALANFRDAALRGIGRRGSKSPRLHTSCWEGMGCYGEHLLFGIGVVRDEVSAIKFIFEAADHGDQRSCLMAAQLLARRRAELLGEAMLPGDATRLRQGALTRANRLLKPIARYARTAVEGGYREALALYADVLFDMGGHDESALVCYAHLAHAGDPHGCCRVGWMVILGRGTSERSEAGWALVGRAAEQGDAEAQALLAGQRRSAA